MVFAKTCRFLTTAWLRILVSGLAESGPELGHRPDPGIGLLDIHYVSPSDLTLKMNFMSALFAGTYVDARSQVNIFRHQKLGLYLIAHLKTSFFSSYSDREDTPIEFEPGNLHRVDHSLGYVDKDRRAQ